MSGGPRFAYICLLSLLYARRPFMAVQGGTGRMLLFFSLYLTVGVAAS